MSAENGAFRRLPTTVVPSLYKVTIKPNLQNLTFIGSEQISVVVTSPTCEIVLNAFDMTVDAATLQVGSLESLKPKITCSPRTQTVTFTFENSLEAGDYVLEIDFTGKLNDQLRGLYRNKYTSSKGEVRYAAVTHFEATGARRAYPCWDEPVFKSKFIFIIIAPKDRVVLSNMPEESRNSLEDDLVEVVFQITPTMSTYLTALVVGEYDHVEDTAAAGTKLRVFTPVGKSKQGLFALEVAKRSLEFYEWYFGVPYGLPKLDLITLSEFPIGAMENWGLVTYRETALLYDPLSSTAATRQRIAIIVAHELSHNWFGNLVTMSWWTDLWLKEGFATWMEYHCIDALYPEFNIWSHFIKMDQNAALRLDSLSNSHPVEVSVQDPGEIDEIFDQISYSKGACLIRMLQSYIGDQAFRDGMKIYLDRHKYSNTETTDMWRAMSETSGQDMTEIMSSWTKKMGFPLIKITELEADKPDTRRVRLSQEKFSTNKSSVEHPALWYTPYSITTTNSPNEPAVKGLLESRSTEITIPNCSPDHWIKLNPGQFMFYHAQYPKSDLHRLVKPIQDGTLTVEDRIGLVTDQYALCRGNYTSVVEFIRFTESFQDEKTFAVCSQLLNAFSSLSPLVEQLTGGDMVNYKSIVCSRFLPIALRLGWDKKQEEGHTDTLLREQVLTVLGSNGDPDVKSEAFSRFDKHCQGTQLLTPDIKMPVYSTVSRHGGLEYHDKLMVLYDKEDSLEEKLRISRVLGYNPDPNIKQKVLDFALSESVRNQDRLYVIAGVGGSIKGKHMVWEFVEKHWQELYRRYGSSTLLKSLIDIVTYNVCEQSKLEEIRIFFSNHEAKAAERAIQQGLEHIEANVAFLKQQGEELKLFLTSNIES